MTDGVTVIRFLDVNEEKTERTMTLKFKFDVADSVEARDYEVKVEAVAAEGTEDGEDFINATCTSGKITVQAAHTHSWDEGVMTTMPTTTSNGVITYTCTDADCGETKTEDFVVSGSNNIYHYSDYYATEVASVKSQYAAIVNSSAYSAISNLGGNATECGVILTRDGSTPVCGSAATLYSEAIDIDYGNGLIGYFYNMNLEQMGQTLKFRAYVKFTYNEQTCYYYGDVYSTVFIAALATATDAQSKALVELYNAKQNATNIIEQCNGTVVETGNSGITDYSDYEYTQIDLLSSKIQYAAIVDSSVYSTISTSGGNATECGVILTRDGSTPVCGTAATLYSEAIDTDYGNGLIGYFYNMNLEQMGQTLKFRAYVKYTDSSGNTQYIYGNTVSFKFIDVLKDVAGTNNYATKLLSYYNSYLAS